MANKGGSVRTAGNDEKLRWWFATKQRFHEIFDNEEEKSFTWKNKQTGFGAGARCRRDSNFL